MAKSTNLFWCGKTYSLIFLEKNEFLKILHFVYLIYFPDSLFD